MTRRRRVLTVAMAAVMALGLGISDAKAQSGAPPPGSTGHDVSYPQCTSSGSSSTTVGSLGGAFGIVGVTNGLPWSANPCLGSEYAWAIGLAYQPGLYINTANPAPHSSFFWPTSGSYAPALCQDSASTADPGCAYDYGWHAAQAALSAASGTISGASAAPWWLDVETGNSWNGTTSSNTADLQGFVDYLRGPGGVPSVGIYSSISAWDSITGGYSATNAATYRSAWSSEIQASPYPLSASPTWVAGAGSSSTASATCAQAAFTGTSPALAQYRDSSGYDADLVCGSPSTLGSFSLAIAPQSATVAPGQSITTTVAVNESGPDQPVSLSASGQLAEMTISFAPNEVTSSASSAMRVAVGSGVPAGTYPLTITGTGSSSGSHSGTFTLTVAVPTHHRRH